jgi:hypothetical protein
LDDAAAALREAIRLEPESKGYHFALGLALQLKGDLTGALHEFHLELAIEPNPAASRQIAEIEKSLPS